MQGDPFLETGVITRNHVREETVVIFPFHLHAFFVDPFHVLTRVWIRFVKLILAGDEFQGVARTQEWARERAVWSYVGQAVAPCGGGAQSLQVHPS